MRRALCAAAALVAIASAPVAGAWGEFPTVTPGAFLVSTVLADNGQPYQCTAAFVVRGPDGAPGVLTAGHCHRDPVNDAVLQRTPSGDQMIGRYTRWETVPGGHDVGLVDLTGSPVPLSAEIEGMPVSRVLTAEDLRRERPELCKAGARTGLSCGPLTDVSDTQVSFRAWDDLGDSGAPVYARQADGSVAAVGILFAHADDEQGRVIQASLVAPVMDLWGLRLGS